MNRPSAAEALENARRELLDLGINHNSLLNFRQSSRVGVEIIGERTADVFRILVTEQKSMGFLAAKRKTKDPKAAQGEGAETGTTSAHLSTPAMGDEAVTEGDENEVALDDLDLPSGEDAYTDRFLQTRYKRESLEARLRITSEEAATHIEEQGVNILYLALGFLHWRDPNGEERRAPLILVPAVVDKATVTSKYAVAWNKDDLGSNLSLQEKLRADFAIELDALDDQDVIDPVAYIEQVRAKVAHLDGWEVATDEMTLGFFSFGKFLMYRDLDASLWPEGDKPYDHPVLDGILVSGFADVGPVLAGDGKLDQVHRPGVTTEVMDADSSQALVLEEAHRGRHLVIQGPPGTGKSQTITNLIAAAVVSGKKVLFVAEKMAALEVVKRRMDNIGIGDCALELHSHKSSKKHVLAELKRVLELGEPLLGDLGQSATELAQSRDRLNAYCQAVSTPIGTSGKTPYHLMGEMLMIDRDGAVPRLPFAPLASWNADTFNERLAIVDELQRVIASLGVPRQHPWFGMTRTIFLPSEMEGLGRHLQEAKDSVAELQTASIELATSAGLTTPVNLESTERLSRSVEILLRMPTQTTSVAFADRAWIEKAADLRTLVTQGTKYQDLHAQYAALVIPEAWTQNLLKTRQALKVHGAKLLRMLSGDYRQARAQLIGLCVDTPPAALNARVALVDGIMEAQRLTTQVNAAESWVKPFTGTLWSGTQTAWKTLQTVADWLSEAHRAVEARTVAPELLSRISAGPLPAQVAAQRSVVDAAVQRARTALDTLTRELGWKAVVPPRTAAGAPGPAITQPPQNMEPVAVPALEAQSLATLAHQIASWQEHLPVLNAYLGYLRLAERCTECGLGHVIPWAQQWEPAGTRLAATVRRSWFAGWLDQAHRERPELSQFDQVNHEEVVARFCRAEELTFAYNRARVALHHWQGLPGGGGGVGQLGILRRQTELKTRHWPIRQLLAHAPQAVQAVKPVFMMSPMSVATFLAPEGPRFDLVVFDEASQIRPVDAFGALMRGTQAVVVGDSKQMPPSSFFDRIMVSDGAVNEDDFIQLQSTADVESVLGLMKARGVPERMLRWHYRSRHPSLIAVSNHDFYENRLIVSPSPDHGETPDGAGLSLRHLPNTSYDRGGTRTNVGEAQAVAEAVMAHAKTRSHRTLGVVAFSVAQKHAIEDALAKLRKADPTAEVFFTAHPNEPFFCKNLENVQGDERDVIFISIGYGKTAEGYLAMQFGPLSGPGGERRLNVLISRARYRCEVFTNLLAEDIATERTQAVGVRSLKNFLQFAQTRRLGHLDVAEDQFDSPFEEEVVYALRRLGHTVHTQVGSAGFRVDLAVVDPKHPGRYLLGIECDGATYHQQAWARDRDRLREDVLRGMGWEIHRIWSTSWFSNPDAQLRAVVAAIERAATVPTGITSNPAGAARTSPGTSPDTNETVAKQHSALPQGSAAAELQSVQPAPAASARAHPAPAAQAPGEIARDHRRTRSTTSLVSPYRIAQEVFATSGELKDANPASIAQVLTRIVAIESPVHIEDLHRRFLAAAGAGRTGSRIQIAIESGLGHAVTKRTIIRRGDFCWKPDEERAKPRYRGTDHPGKRFDYVAPEEIAEAVILAVRESFGLPREDVPKAASKLLGFQALPDDAHQAIDQLVHQLIHDGRIAQVGAHVRHL